MSRPKEWRQRARDKRVIDFATARRDRIAHRPLTDDAAAIKRQALRARLGHDGPEAA